MPQKHEITRRQFLRISAAAVGGMAAYSVMGPLVFAPAKAEGAAVSTNPFDLTRGTVLLNNGVEMPILGLGTFNLTEEQAEASAYWALKAGHRLIDTAAAYNNEAGVGRGIKKAIEECIVTREEICLLRYGGLCLSRIQNADRQHGCVAFRVFPHSGLRGGGKHGLQGEGRLCARRQSDDGVCV